jgi:hypothetical protein
MEVLYDGVMMACPDELLIPDVGDLARGLPDDAGTGSE